MMERWAAADLVTRVACHQPRSGGCGRPENRSKKPALFSSLLSLLARQKAGVLVGGGARVQAAGVKRDRTQVDVRVLLGSVGRRQFLAGPGRGDQPRLGAALLQDTYHHHHTAGKVTLRVFSGTKRSWSVVCRSYCYQSAQCAPLGSLAMEVGPLPIVPGCSVAYPGPGPGSALQIVSTD